VLSWEAHVGKHTKLRVVYEGGDRTASDLACMGQEVAHEVHAATLPGGIEHFGDGCLDALVRVRDHELDAPQASAGELAQERGPERLGHGRADVHAEHLAPAIAVDVGRDNHRDRDDGPVPTLLQVVGIDPQIRPVALDRTGQEGLHFLVDLCAEPDHQRAIINARPSSPLRTIGAAQPGKMPGNEGRLPVWSLIASTSKGAGSRPNSWTWIRDCASQK
jgi:hypothetical protein